MLTLAEGRRARANLRREGCKALLRFAAACGEEEEARKKQAELRHQEEGELAPALLREGLLGCGHEQGARWENWFRSPILQELGW